MNEELHEAAKYYELINYRDTKAIIRSNINSMAGSFVAIGYYLKHIRDNEMFREDGYESIWDLAQAEFGISKSQASKFMTINDKFSKDGNSPILTDKYKDFSSSKLQEMLYLTDEQLEQVTPVTTVAEIREIRKPEEVVSTSKQEPESTKEHQPCKFGGGKCTLYYNPEVACWCETRCSNGFITDQQMEPEPAKLYHQYPKVCKYDGKSNCVAMCDTKAECCAECPDHGNCNCECGWQDERVPKQEYHEEAWFVRWYFKLNPNDLAKLMRMCRVSKSRSDIAKEFQKYRSPYGALYSGCSEWEYSFHNFAGGIDFRVGKEKMHMKYGRLVEETLNLYDPFDRKYDEKKPGEQSKPVNDTRETVNHKAASVTETCETVIEDSESDISERQCSNCNYNDMDPDEYRVDHPESKEFPCNICDDKLNNWIPKVEEPEDEHEEVETVEADIIQTVPEEVKQGTNYSINAVYSIFLKAKSDYEEVIKVGGAPDKLVEKRLIIRDALLDYYQELRGRDTVWYQKPQPELPILKNNDQRKDFIDAYETWPIWIDQKLTGERYYRYDLSDKVAMVVKVSWKHSWENYRETKGYEFGAEQYYLLGIKSEWHQTGVVFTEDETKTFCECSSNKSALVDYLKYFQKKGA